MKEIEMSDSWCKRVLSKNGTWVSGGAARNVRIAASGGMDSILEEVAREAATAALDRANRATRKANVRLVKAAAY
jgi:hypothetical protein